MDKLSALPRKTLSSIHHTRTGGSAVRITPPDAEDDVYFRVPFVLNLLLGLRLDSLTVLGDTIPRGHISDNRVLHQLWPWLERTCFHNS